MANSHQRRVAKREAKLRPADLVALVVSFVSLVLLFFVAAPAAAGVFDMNLARLLLVGGWIVAIVVAIAFEILSHRSRKRVVITGAATAVLVGALGLYANDWIVQKKAAQDSKDLASKGQSASTASSPSPSPTPITPIAPTPSPKSHKKQQQATRELSEQEQTKLDRILTSKPSPSPKNDD